VLRNSRASSTINYLIQHGQHAQWPAAYHLSHEPVPSLRPCPARGSIRPACRWPTP